MASCREDLRSGACNLYSLVGPGGSWRLLTGLRTKIDCHYRSISCLDGMHPEANKSIALADALVGLVDPKHETTHLTGPSPRHRPITFLAQGTACLSPNHPTLSRTNKCASTGPPMLDRPSVNDTSWPASNDVAGMTTPVLGLPAVFQEPPLHKLAGSQRVISAANMGNDGNTVWSNGF